MKTWEWGGECVCPNGEVLYAGDMGNGCTSLACPNGFAKTCSKNAGTWSGKFVECALENPSLGSCPRDMHDSLENQDAFFEKNDPEISKTLTEIITRQELAEISNNPVPYSSNEVIILRLSKFNSISIGNLFHVTEITTLATKQRVPANKQSKFAIILLKYLGSRHGKLTMRQKTFC